MLNKQLIFAIKDMRKENVNEAKNEDEHNKIMSNVLLGCLSNSYIFVKEEFLWFSEKKINCIFSDFKASSSSQNPVP